MPSQPHGRVLVNRVLTGRARAEMGRAAAGFPTLALSEQQIREVENLATGVFSPLEGFMGECEARDVLLRRAIVEVEDVEAFIQPEVAQDPEIGESLCGLRSHSAGASRLA